MEERIFEMLNRRLSIRQCKDPGDNVAWGVFYGDRLIAPHETERAARIALVDAVELRAAIYDVLVSED